MLRDVGYSCGCEQMSRKNVCTVRTIIFDMAIIIFVGVHRSMAESGWCSFSAIATCVGHHRCA